jgi:ATP-dependent DNA helicase RecG
MRRIVRSVAAEFAGYVDEVFPDDFRHRHGLAGVHDALAEIHAPSDRQSLAYARRRFIFQELLIMQLALAIRRANWLATAAASLPLTAKIDARIRRLFPFPLTAAQDQATREICADMARDRAMNRLLQGDVGSGKTVVAQYAMLVAVANSYQAVLMAPTEVLARQHAKTFAESLKHSRARIGLLTGSMSPAERRTTTEAVAKGGINLLIGTHAVLSDDVTFNKLGLVVIDEQHKFGVQQRARLREAGLNPHYMVMTATPIPRTISMTQFGDLDVSTLRQGPPGRQQVHTYIGALDQRKRKKPQWSLFDGAKLRCSLPPPWSKLASTLRMRL